MINEGKTCEGCVYWTPPSGTYDDESVGEFDQTNFNGVCMHPETIDRDTDRSEYCEGFEPNLLYRQTVALEGIRHELVALGATKLIGPFKA